MVGWRGGGGGVLLSLVNIPYTLKTMNGSGFKIHVK